MKRIAITGGIGSGKSFVCRLLERQGIQVYDCDAAAKRLMVHSPSLRQQLTALIGPETYTSDEAGQSYQLNKAVVARFLLASQRNASAIDAIVHPAVAADFLESGIQWLESAILFQSGFDRRVHFDAVVCVTAPEEVRIGRIMARDGISKERAREWIARQWPQEDIRLRSDYEIINDGQQPLLPQIETILQKYNSLVVPGQQ